MGDQAPTSADQNRDRPAKRVVVVTGAASGIGAETAARLANDGWAVIAVDRDQAGLEELSGRHESQVTGIMGDVADPATHEKIEHESVSVGRLEGWVNSAGVYVSDTADSLKLATLRSTLEVNVVGTALGCSTAIRMFLDSSVAGAIVNVSSIHAVAGFPGAFSYQATKGAVDAMTRQLAAEYGPQGIRCNAIQPGTIRTPLTESSFRARGDVTRELERAGKLHALGRIGEPEEVASVIAFLLSTESSFVSGVTLAVDGGATARCYATDNLPDAK